MDHIPKEVKRIIREQPVTDVNHTAILLKGI